jgi:hypothetical protein
MHHIEPDPCSYQVNDKRGANSTKRTNQRGAKFAKTKRFKRNPYTSNKLGPGCYKIEEKRKNQAIDLDKKTGRATLACTLGF